MKRFKPSFHLKKRGSKEYLSSIYAIKTRTKEGVTLVRIEITDLWEDELSNLIASLHIRAVDLAKVYSKRKDVPLIVEHVDRKLSIVKRLTIHGNMIDVDHTVNPTSQKEH